MKKLALHWQIFIGMAIGAAVGLPLNVLAENGAIDESIPRTLALYGKQVGDLFLRLLSMVVTPLILTSLVTGIAGTGDLKGLGRLSGWTFGYYVASSLLAITIGILAVNLIEPGVGADFETLQRTAEAEQAGGSVVTPEILETGGSLGQTLWNQLLNLIPKNPIAAMADPGNRSILAVIFFALLLGVFILRAGGRHGKVLTEVFAAGFEVMMRMTMFIIRLAPIGVLGFMLYAAAGKGLHVFVALGQYMITVLLALAVHAFVTLPLILIFFAKRRPHEFFQQMSPALLTAFSTASSSGTLPLTITCAEQRARIPNRVSSFVLPLGATINMDGTALYEAVAVLFIAQALGNDLDAAQQVVVALTALLASIGAAGIPHAGTVMMVVVLQAVGLPVEHVGLILAVDRILDMCRTSINLWSDSVATAVVARWSGALDGPSGPPPDDSATPLDEAGSGEAPEATTPPPAAG
ncbi:MAG: dicarboxylate/amino acid:cation symporter [Planctomycetota bacterium JB042]